MKDDVTAFHRKYRPNDLDSLKGNIKIKEALLSIKSMSDTYKPQVLLIKGPTGCGKTTTARLLGQVYACEGEVDPDSSKIFCESCSHCEDFKTYIKTGLTKDIPYLHEFNCSDIDSAKSNIIAQKIKNDDFASFYSTWSIYIFDEAQLLTPKSMGNLLKSIEEPPEKVLIILCTTNPESLLDTLKNRCQMTLDVKKPSEAEAVSIMQTVCVKEKIVYDLKALQLIARVSDNTPRTCLTNLETIYKQKGKVGYSDTTDVLGTISDIYYFRFLKFLKNMNVINYMIFLGEIRSSIGIKDFVGGLKDFLSRIIRIYYGAEKIVEKSELKDVKSLLDIFTTKEIGIIIEMCLKISSSDSKELELQKLGFRNIFAKPESENITELFSEPLQTQSTLKQAELEQHNEKHLERRTCTETEVTEVIQSASKTINFADLLNKHNG